VLIKQPKCKVALYCTWSCGLLVDSISKDDCKVLPRIHTLTFRAFFHIDITFQFTVVQFQSFHVEVHAAGLLIKIYAPTHDISYNSRCLLIVRQRGQLIVKAHLILTMSSKRLIFLKNQYSFIMLTII